MRKKGLAVGLCINAINALVWAVSSLTAAGSDARLADMPAARAITQEAARNDYRFSSLVEGIVNSRPFQMATAPESWRSDYRSRAERKYI